MGTRSVLGMLSCAEGNNWLLVQVAGKIEDVDPVWKCIGKEVDLDDSTHLLDQAAVDNDVIRTMSDPFKLVLQTPPKSSLMEISAVTEKVKLAKLTAWSYDMKSHAEKCVDKYCELSGMKFIESSCRNLLKCTTIRFSVETLKSAESFKKTALTLL